MMKKKDRGGITNFFICKKNLSLTDKNNYMSKEYAL